MAKNVSEKNKRQVMFTFQHYREISLDLEDALKNLGDALGSKEYTLRTTALEW